MGSFLSLSEINDGLFLEDVFPKKDQHHTWPFIDGVYWDSFDYWYLDDAENEHKDTHDKGVQKSHAADSCENCQKHDCKIMTETNCLWIVWKSRIHFFNCEEEHENSHENPGYVLVAVDEFREEQKEQDKNEIDHSQPDFCGWVFIEDEVSSKHDGIEHEEHSKEEFVSESSVFG